MTTAEWLDRQRREDLRRLKGFRLIDDDFLTKCFEGETTCIQLVLRIVLEIPDLEVVDVRTQVFVENLLNRSVRLDVLATDSAGRKMNVEIQRSDKGAGRKRARYNSSMMDANLLRKGEDFEALPETYVVFITEHDVIGGCQPLYRVERYISGSGKRFGDGSHILYVNGAYRDETPIGKLMHDFFCTDPADMYYDELAERVRFFKESREGIAIMCKVMEDMRNESLKEGRKQGLKEGLEQGMKQGIEQGLKQGVEQGIKQGVEQGLKQGVEQGLKQGVEQGLKQGVEQGLKQGVEQGLKQGVEQGLKQGIQTTVFRMLETGKYALEEIAEISGLSLDEVKKLQAK